MEGEGERRPAIGVTARFARSGVPYIAGERHGPLDRVQVVDQWPVVGNADIAALEDGQDTRRQRLLDRRAVPTGCMGLKPVLQTICSVMEVQRDMAGWHFKKRDRSDEVADPIQAEFFDEAGDPDERRRGPAASLVREAIQNSLDAQAEEDPVHVRFYLSEAHPLPERRASAWFGDLWPHLCAKRSGLRDSEPEPSACRFLVVEDFGTKGLEGDARREQTPDEGEIDDFFAFFRGNGLSGKAGQEGGRWGVGKSVFSRASEINAFVAFSVRRSDGYPFLIGRCFLLTHKMNGDEYQPYGRYGVAEDDQFVLPVKDAKCIRAFREDFCIAREEGTPGLSVVVPYLDEEITSDALVSAVAREYFYPILAGRLTVQVGRIQLTDQGILDRLESSGEKDLLGAVRLAGWARKYGRSESVTMRSQEQYCSPAWSEELFPVPDELKRLADRFQRQEPIAVRAPVYVHPPGRQPQRSFFDVYLKRDHGGRGYPPVFVRSGIIIPRALGCRVRGHDLHAIVVVEDKALSSMLGDAETPAHTHWSPDTRNFKGKYDYGAATINFVRTAPRQIAEILTRAQDERDWLALADFFPRPPEDEGLPEPARQGAADDGDLPEPPPPLVEHTPQPFLIEHIGAGFRVVRDNSERTRLPAVLRISVAYDTSRGNPLTRYHPADFELGRRPVRVDAKSAQVIEVGANRLLVQLVGDDFCIEASGFDVNRDLYVRVDPRTQDAAEPEADAEAPDTGRVAT